MALLMIVVVEKRPSSSAMMRLLVPKVLVIIIHQNVYVLCLLYSPLFRSNTDVGISKRNVGFGNNICCNFYYTRSLQKSVCWTYNFEIKKIWMSIRILRSGSFNKTPS